jgi:putative SOS response-associated peptidase YedK
MCYRKTLDSDWDIIKEHYQASFESITEELNLIRERFQILMARDERTYPYTPEETAEIKFCQRTLQNFTETGVRAYNENGFEHLATPIITAEQPHKFTLSRWGLVSNQRSLEYAYGRFGPNTLNCVTEEMRQTPTYVKAVKNAQRCLVPVTSYFEPHWVDPKGKNKVTYLIRYKHQRVFSLGGIYFDYKDPTTGKNTHTYSIFTQKATPLMAKIHNGESVYHQGEESKRMVFVIPKDLESAFLNRDLPLDDVLAIGRHVQDSDFIAYTVPKMVTSTKGETNVPEVLMPHDFGVIGGVRVIPEYK